SVSSLLLSWAPSHTPPARGRTYSPSARAGPHAHTTADHGCGATEPRETADEGTVYSALDTDESEIDDGFGSSQGRDTEYHPSPERSSSEGSAGSDAKNAGTDSDAKPD